MSKQVQWGAMVLVVALAIGGIFMLLGGEAGTRRTRGDEAGDLSLARVPLRSPELETEPDSEAERSRRDDARLKRAPATPQERIKKQRDELERLFRTVTSEPDVGQRRKIARRIEFLMKRVGGEISAASHAHLLNLLPTIEPATLRRVLGRAAGHVTDNDGYAEEMAGLLARHMGDRDTLTGIGEALAGMQSQAAVPELIRHLGDGSSDLADIVARTLAKIGGSDADRALIALLTNDVPRRLRNMIERSWKKDAGIESFARVAAALGTPDPMAQKSLLRILGRSREGRHAARVIRAFEASDQRSVRASAIDALGKFGDARSTEYLIRVISTGGKIAKDAERALQGIENREVLETVAQQWSGFSATGRRALLRAAANFDQPPKKLVTLAGRSLRDPDAGVRMSAARVLGRPRNDSAIPVLIGYLERAETKNDRLAAMQALRGVGTQEAGAAALEVMAHREGAFVATYRDLFRQMADG